MVAAARGKAPKRPVKPIPVGAKSVTPPQFARQLQVAPEFVIGEIRAGRLPAIDLAKPGSRRPRYRISIESIEAFEKRRSVVPPAKPTARLKRDHSAGVTQFY